MRLRVYLTRPGHYRAWDWEYEGSFGEVDGTTGTVLYQAMSFIEESIKIGGWRFVSVAVIDWKEGYRGSRPHVDIDESNLALMRLRECRPDLFR